MGVYTLFGWAQLARPRLISNSGTLEISSEYPKPSEPSGMTSLISSALAFAAANKIIYKGPFLEPSQDYLNLLPHSKLKMLTAASKNQKTVLAAAGIAGASYFLIRSFVYRPAQKQHANDLLVPVERSGGGL